MCLTIPKKVISINGGVVIVENPNGDRQEMKTIVELKPGDFCLTQQNVVIDKMDKSDAQDLIKEIRRIKEKEEIL
ncbi:MAG: HypC/HybG/HupF family hydrogenase formation chaperone [Candidatus Pacebacteria bacterium]|nr:HypC/HybG/HupF family hydrogenase formation chaperone [Candidatus Paceibacterota bacterium]